MKKVVAESASHMVKCECPNCARTVYFEVSDIWNGSRRTCPECQERFIIIQSEREASFDQL